jgi:hypothetical protein
MEHVAYKWKNRKQSFFVENEIWCKFVTHLNNLGSTLLHITIDDKLLHAFGIVQQNCNKQKTKKD